MNQYETVATLKESLNLLLDEQIASRIEDVTLILAFIEKLQPGSSLTLQDRLPLKIYNLSKVTTINAGEFVALCLQDTEIALTLASEKWSKEDPASFLEACEQNPLAALSHCAKEWQNLDPEGYFKVVESNLPDGLELLVGDQARLVKACQNYPEYAIEEVPEHWAKLDPESYLRYCQDNYEEVLKHAKATLLWKELDNEGCLEAFGKADLGKEDLLKGLLVAPEVLRLIAEVDPRKVVGALRSTTYTDALLSHPGLWWEIDPKNLTNVAASIPGAALLTVPYMTSEMKTSILKELRKDPQLVRDWNGGALLDALENDIWEVETLYAATRNTLVRLFNAHKEKQDTGYHQGALVWELEKAKKLDMLESLFDVLMRFGKTGNLDVVIQNLPTYPGYCLDGKLADLADIVESNQGSQGSGGMGGILGPLASISAVIQGFTRNEELMVENVKHSKTTLQGGAGNLVNYLLDDLEARELTRYILDTPGMDSDTMRWALERAGNLQESSTPRVRRPRTIEEGRGRT